MLRANAILALAVVLIPLACFRDPNGDEETTDDDELREDVLWCEDALGHLALCCPGFVPSNVPCHYRDHSYVHNGCGASTSGHDEVHPALSLDESRCIRQRSCADITQSICDRAQAATAYSESNQETSAGSSSSYCDGGWFCEPTSSSSRTSSTHPPVCP